MDYDALKRDAALDSWENQHSFSTVRIRKTTPYLTFDSSETGRPPSLELPRTEHLTLFLSLSTAQLPDDEYHPVSRATTHYDAKDIKLVTEDHGYSSAPKEAAAIWGRSLSRPPSSKADAQAWSGWRRVLTGSWEHGIKGS